MNPYLEQIEQLKALRLEVKRQREHAQLRTAEAESAWKLHNQMSDDLIKLWAELWSMLGFKGDVTVLSFEFIPPIDEPRTILQGNPYPTEESHDRS